MAAKIWYMAGLSVVAISLGFGRSHSLAAQSADTADTLRLDAATAEVYQALRREGELTETKLPLHRQ